LSDHSPEPSPAMPRRPKPKPRPDVLALLRACRDRPHENMPRLVLADWLEENGDEAERGLGELIRLGCERHDRVWRDLDDDYSLLYPTGQEKQLMAAHCQAWLGQLADYGCGWSVDRGLFEVNCLASNLEDLPAPDLAEGWHWVYQLTVPRARRNVTAIAASPVVGQVGWLDLSGESLQSQGWRQLADSAYLNGVTGLVLHRCKIGRNELKEVLRCSEWRGLRHLDLTGNIIDSDALGHLLAWPGLPRLQTLVLAGNRIGNVGLQMLGACRALTGLEVLDLSGALFGMAGIVELSASPHLPSLRRLDARPELAWQPAGEAEEALALLSSPVLPHLEVLRLPKLAAADVFLQRLASSPRPLGLRALDLVAAHITSRTAGALLKARSLPRLEYLSVRVEHAAKHSEAFRQRFRG
jgi:uncharacterized protein (TIGR02996 family)